MNVPPLITAAVRATDKAPSDRLPRKYFWRNPALRLATRFATTPRPSDTSVKITSASRVAGWAWIASALGIDDPFPDVPFQLGRVVPAQVVVDHEEPREPDREQGTDAPGHDVTPEHPRRHPQDRPDVGPGQGVFLRAIPEPPRVEAAIQRAGQPGQPDDNRLAARVADDGVGQVGQ